MWDSELMARIGIWVTEIEEEEDLVMTPDSSPIAALARPVTAGSPNSSVDFGEVPLGPGGNARWDARRESSASLLSARSSGKPVPSDKRIMIKACEFDLREHTATLQCGTRGLQPGVPDLRTRVTQIIW